MLFKYLGTVYDEKAKADVPRHDFLTNGLFRMTQPKFLNDKSEGKFFPYINEFSPADIAYARRRHCSINITPNTPEPSEEFLINFYLKPTGRRSSIENYPDLLGFTNYSNLEEYKLAHEKQMFETIEGFNTFIYEALSSQIGVFSLSENAENRLMWAHYANQGKGLIVSFKEDHPFFKKFGLRKVSYNIEDRASISYYDGVFRINGEPASNYNCTDELGNFNYFNLLSKDFRRNSVELSYKLLFTKTNHWNYEEEKRLICPLTLCEKKIGKVIKPNLAGDLPESLSNYFSDYSQIYLKQIPFDAYESIIFGYDVDEPQKNKIIKIAIKNPDLGHLKFKQASFDIHGNIFIEDLRCS